MILRRPRETEEYFFVQKFVLLNVKVRCCSWVWGVAIGVLREEREDNGKIWQADTNKRG
jgi:hypothetical protein